MADATRPAGFWQRYAAWSMDAVPVLALSCAATADRLRTMVAWVADAAHALADGMASIVMSVLGQGGEGVVIALLFQRVGPLREGIERLALALTEGLQATVAVFVALTLIYHTAFEQTRWRGTPGKHWLGILVADDRGGPPPLYRSALRNAAGALSWLTLNIGHVMAALPPQYRALHDRIAGTRVLTGSSRLPLWAQIWLYAQIALGFGLFVWATAWMQRALDAAIGRALGY